MSLTPPAGLQEDDFDAIEDAVMETARGRWFLREFARRARAAETSRLMDSLVRIEAMLATQRPAAESAALDIEDHARSLEERHGRLGEIGWMLRERGYDGDICAMIEKEARAVGRLARTLRGEERRHVDAPRVEDHAPAQLEAPRPVESAMKPSFARVDERDRAGENDVSGPPPDAVADAPAISETSFESPADLPPASVSATVAPLAPAVDWRSMAAAAFAPIDRMSTREKLALFA
jgi:hypothetical protein